MSADYLSMLTKRAQSKVAQEERAVLCLDPERMQALTAARKAFLDAQRFAPQPAADGSKPPVKRAAVDALRAANKAVTEAENAARAASVWIVVKGISTAKVLGSQAAGLDADASQKALVVAAFVRAESVVDGSVIPEITPDVFAEIFPQLELSAGELGLLMAAVNRAGSGPDFPTSPRQ